MLDTAIKLKILIIGVCAVRRFDTSMKHIQLTEDDWLVLVSLRDFIQIFMKPTTYF